MSRKFDINGDPIYSPSLDQQNYNFNHVDETNANDSFNNSFEQPNFSPSQPNNNFYHILNNESFNNFVEQPRQNNDDILSSMGQINTYENNYFQSPLIPIIPYEARNTEAETQRQPNPETKERRTYPIFEVISRGKRRGDKIYLHKAKHTKDEKGNHLTHIKKASYNNYLVLFNQKKKILKMKK